MGGSQALSDTHKKKKKNKRYIKKQALKESFKSMPFVIMSGSAVISKKMANALNEEFRGEAI